LSLKEEVDWRVGHVRFSNRPFWVKRFQTIHRCVVDVARRLALPFGIGAPVALLLDHPQPD
jgi:hypothetical protein